MMENTQRGVRQIMTYMCPKNSYIGPKLYNMIPKGIKEATTADDFKDRLKGWIWKNIH